MNSLSSLMPRWMQRPGSAVARSLAPLVTKMSTRAYAEYLAPGEVVLAVDTELGATGRWWIASTEALYFTPLPTPTNKNNGPGVIRIP